MRKVLLFAILLAQAAATQAQPDQQSEPTRAAGAQHPSSPSHAPGPSLVRPNPQGVSNPPVSSELDAALATLQSTLNALSLAFDVLGAALAFVAALGFFEAYRWRKTRKEAEDFTKSLHDLRHRLEARKLALSTAIAKSGAELRYTPSSEQLDTASELATLLAIVELLGLPLNANDYVNLAIDCYYRKRKKRALEYLEQATNAEPKSSVAWNYKSMILLSEKRSHDALSAADKALKFDALNESAWNNRACALLNLRRHEAAEEALKKALEIRTDFEEAWYNQAVAQLRGGRRDEALASLEHSIRCERRNRTLAQKDPDFAELREDQRFRTLTAHRGGR